MGQPHEYVKNRRSIITSTMPLSARNRIEGVVKAVEKGEVASIVKIEVAKPVTITAMITFTSSL